MPIINLGGGGGGGGGGGYTITTSDYWINASRAWSDIKSLTSYTETTPPAGYELVLYFALTELDGDGNEIDYATLQVVITSVETNTQYVNIYTYSSPFISNPSIGVQVKVIFCGSSYYEG